MALCQAVEAGRCRPGAAHVDGVSALGCQLADPCWEGVAGRGRGLVAAAHGDVEGATVILLDALQRCARLPDACAWGGAYVLDAACTVAITLAGDLGPPWASRLLANEIGNPALDALFV